MQHHLCEWIENYKMCRLIWNLYSTEIVLLSSQQLSTVFFCFVSMACIMFSFFFIYLCLSLRHFDDQQVCLSFMTVFFMTASLVIMCDESQSPFRISKIHGNKSAHTHTHTMTDSKPPACDGEMIVPMFKTLSIQRIFQSHFTEKKKFIFKSGNVFSFLGSENSQATQILCRKVCPCQLPTIFSAF